MNSTVVAPTPKDFAFACLPAARAGLWGWFPSEQGIIVEMNYVAHSLEEMNRFASELGRRCEGGEVLELVGDVGTGKTTFTKGFATGLGVTDDVQSPSFTISRFYAARDGLELHHYDLYRLVEPGIAQYDIAESVGDPKAVTVIEWGETVHGVLPANRTIIHFRYGDAETERHIELTSENPKLKEDYNDTRA